MASIGIKTVREEYPGKTDQEAAAIIAREGGYDIVVRYKLFPDGPYSNFGLCRTQQEADLYFDNRNLHDVEAIYGRRSD